MPEVRQRVGIQVPTPEPEPVPVTPEPFAEAPPVAAAPAAAPAVPEPEVRILTGGRREKRYADRVVTYNKDGSFETRLDAVPGGLVVSTPPRRRRH